MLCLQGLGVLLVCPIGEVGPGAMELVWSRVRTSITVMELTPSTWLAVRGPSRSARVPRGYGSSWIFELDLTCTNAFRRVQHPAFSLGVVGARVLTAVRDNSARPVARDGDIALGGG